MGWKASLVIIENKNHFNDENLLIAALGFDNLTYKGEATFEEAIFPDKGTFAIGYVGDNIIICDGYVLTNPIFQSSNGLDLMAYESNLVKLFPDAEILTVSCMGTVNFHGYSLIQNGRKQRLKIVSEASKKEWGEPFAEEKQLYQKAIEQDRQLIWREDGDELTEDQLMEDFTFGVAKRRLGVRIDESEADDLLPNATFKVYEFLELPVNGLEGDRPRPKWIIYVVIVLVCLAWQLYQRMKQ